MYPYTNMNKTPKMQILHQFMELLKGCWVFYAYWEIDGGHQTHFTKAATNPALSKIFQPSTAGFELATPV